MKYSALPLILIAFAAPTLRAEEEAKVETDVAVRVTKIVKATLHRTVTAFGSIEPEPATSSQAPATARLSPALAGIITEINGAEGQQVKKGDVLFKLDSRAVDAAVAKAELAITFANTSVERQKKLIAAGGTSEKLMLETDQALAAAKTELATAKVQQSLLRGEAPMSGTLVMFDAKPGEAADATKALAEVVDLDRLVASVRVPRAEAVTIHAAQRAQLLAGGDTAPIESSVVFVSSQVDAATDTMLVRVDVPKGSGLRPGQFISASIVSEEHKDRLAVPLASVVKDPDDGTVIALVVDGKATRKAVKTGLRNATLIEVEGEGLSEGQTVVTVGAYGLPKETKVRVLNAETK